MQILGGAASELERDFPFGLAIQLFEPLWTTLHADERAALLDGPAGAAGAMLERGLVEATPSPGGQGYPLIHALLWLASHISCRGPLAVLVDDVHWSDPPSLRFLSYLASRLADMPISLVVTVRPGEPAADQQALLALASATSAVTLRPSPISREGIQSLVLSELPDADDTFISACARVTHGNPLLLMELIAQLRADGRSPDASTAGCLTDLAPEAIVNSVIARLSAMPAEERTLACAVSVLGDGASLRHAARLGGLAEESAGRAADGLAAVHMLRPGVPLWFVHPLIRSAIAASMSPLARGHAHRRAALILREDHAAPEAIGVHLLNAPPGEDGDAVETLRVAARKALASGSARSAVRLLERALAEHIGPDARVEILAELGQAEALDGLPQAMDHFTEAIQLTDSPRRRAELGLAQGRTLYDRGLYREAAEVLESVVTGADIEKPLAAELEAAYVSAASLVPSLARRAWTHGERVLAQVADPPTPAQRSAVAHIAVAASLRGEPRSRVSELANLAWGEGALVRDETVHEGSWRLLSAALLFVDELERDVEICNAAFAESPDRGSTLALATVSYCRAWPLYEQGRILEAATNAEAALDARPDDSGMHIRTAYGALACCHIQRGQLHSAGKALATIDVQEARESSSYPSLLDVRAQLRLAEHRPEEALEDALHAGEMLRSGLAADNPGSVAWRSTAALAHLALGQAGRAAELGHAELKVAQRVGVTRVMMRDLRVLGLAKGGAAGIKLLTQAVRMGQRCPPRLEYIHALFELGAALRRANKRAAAREPLRKALELSHRGGATEVARHAQAELTATGARPRRSRLTGVESLTPSQRRVAYLATQGLTTRQMAEALFVSPKTVEFHLRHIYQKLGINTRADLARMIGRAQTRPRRDP